jgi:hypothetical protein
MAAISAPSSLIAPEDLFLYRSNLARLLLPPDSKLLFARLVGDELKRLGYFGVISLCLLKFYLCWAAFASES